MNRTLLGLVLFSVLIASLPLTAMECVCLEQMIDSGACIVDDCAKTLYIVTAFKGGEVILHGIKEIATGLNLKAGLRLLALGSATGAFGLYCILNPLEPTYC